MPSSLIHTSFWTVQPHRPHSCFSAVVAKVCILCKEDKAFVFTSDTKRHSGSFGFVAAAAFAASALTLPVEIKSWLLVCAAHLQIASCFGNRIASRREETREAFRIGRPSDFRNFQFPQRPKIMRYPKRITRICVNRYTFLFH